MTEICNKHGPYSVACRECDYEQVHDTPTISGCAGEAADLEQLDRWFAQIPPGPYDALHHTNGWEVRQLDTDPTNKHHWPFRLCESIAGQRAGCDEAIFSFIAGVINAWPVLRSLTLRAGELERERDAEADALRIGKAVQAQQTTDLANAPPEDMVWVFGLAALDATWGPIGEDMAVELSDFHASWHKPLLNPTPKAGRTEHG